MIFSQKIFHFCRNQKNFALLQIIVLFVFLFCFFCSVLNKHLWFFHFCFVFVLLQDLGFVWSFVYRADSRLVQDELRPLHLQTLGQPTAEHHQGADQDLVHCPAWDDRAVRYYLHTYPVAVPVNCRCQCFIEATYFSSIVQNGHLKHMSESCNKLLNSVLEHCDLV